MREQPQDEETRLTTVAQLRHGCNDFKLDIRWNPESYITRPGCYDVYGQPVRPSYEGRWEVIRHLDDGNLVVVWQVKEEGSEAYKPLGEWLVAFLQRWDRANAHWMDEQKKLFEESERLEAWEQLQALEEQHDNLSRHAVDVMGMNKDQHHFNVRR